MSDTAPPSPSAPVPLRLAPVDDLRITLEAWAARHGAAFVVAGIGSLSIARLRFAGRPDATTLAEDLELLTLSSTLTVDGAHLHASVSTADGRVIGGHVAAGCVVRTTVELLLQPLPHVALRRAHDARTGYPELVVGAVDPRS